VDEVYDLLWGLLSQGLSGVEVMLVARQNCGPSGRVGGGTQWYQFVVDSVVLQGPRTGAVQLG